MATTMVNHTLLEKPRTRAAPAYVHALDTTPDKPSLRTLADEEADSAEVVENLTSGVFADWPNEAGFDGLVEERGPIAVPVTGYIPGWAAGHLYRTGPGQRTVEGTPKGAHNISHWFDGLAHSHRFEIVAGANGAPARVFYSSRRQSEGVAAHLQREGGGQVFSFGQRSDPCVGLLGKFMTTFRAAARGRGAESSDEANICVVVLPDMPPMGTKRTPAMKTTTTMTPPTTPPSAGHRPLPSSVWITTDANLMRKVDPATLEPIGVAAQQSLHPELRGPMSAAHAQRDPATGDVYNFNLELGRNAAYRVFRVAYATGETEVLATIQCGGGGSAAARPAYIHSFFLTEHYVVLCIPSCTHVAHYGLQMMWAHNVVDGLEPGQPDRATRWIVVDRRPGGGGVVAEFDSGPGFFFHSVNAYEEEEDDDENGGVSIICDRMDYPDFGIVRALYYDVLLNEDGAAADFYRDPARVASATPSLSRYRLRLPRAAAPQPPAEEDRPRTHRPQPLAEEDRPQRTHQSAETTALRAEHLWSVPGPHAGELPTIHPACATRRHRFVYSVGSRGLSTLADAVCKTDTATRAALLWRAPHGHTPGEAVFVARPGGGGGAEDDGVLLTVVLDGAARTSALVCLDARTMQELGRAEVGIAIGLGFHGAFVR